MEYGVSLESISIIPNGVNNNEFLADDTFDFKKKLDLEDISFILFLGRLNLIKGPDLLLEAFYNIKNNLQDYCQ